MHRNIRKITFLFFVIVALFQTSSCSVFSDYKEWEERAAEITQGCTTQYEKAMAIFDWECKHIKYDYSYSISRGREAWYEGKGVCQAFSELFVLLANGCNLETSLIQGAARTLDHLDGRASHAWIKAKTEKGWILLDPTWGSCYLEFLYDGDTSLYNNEIGHPNGLHYEWFDVAPEIMVFTHFPSKKKDQLLSEPISIKQYRSLPLLEPRALLWGWNAADLLDYFLNNTTADPPYFYNFSPPECRGIFRFLDVPYSIEEGKEYKVKIETLSEEYYPSGIGEWSKDGNIYFCDITGSKECYGLAVQWEGEFYWSRKVLSYHDVQVRPDGNKGTSDNQGAPWVGIRNTDSSSE